MKSILILIGFFSPFFAKAAAYYYQNLEVSELSFGHHLVWATITEINVATFVIEKSSDGFVFNEIGSLSAAGFSMVDKSYHYMDLKAVEQVSYYRLKEIDSDGVVSFTFPIVLEKKLQNKINVLNLSNTMVSKDFTVTAEVLEACEIECTLKDFSGKNLEKFNHTATAGINKIFIDMQIRPQGDYVLELSLGSEKESFSFRRVADKFNQQVPVASNKELGIRN